MNTYLSNSPYTVLNSLQLPIINSTEFPAHLCTIQDEREADVKYSKVPFLCIVVDIRFPDQCELSIMTPYACYICDSDEVGYDFGYGWQDSNSNWIDNLFQPVHGMDYDDRKVVGWIIL